MEEYSPIDLSALKQIIFNSEKEFTTKTDKILAILEDISNIYIYL